MIEPIVSGQQSLKTDINTGYIDLLLQVALDFAAEIGISAPTEIILSPVDNWGQ